jgi:hypothetical protein
MPQIGRRIGATFYVSRGCRSWPLVARRHFAARRIVAAT